MTVKIIFLFSRSLEVHTYTARGPYWGILIRGRGSTDRVQRAPYKIDRGPIFPGAASTSWVSK